MYILILWLIITIGFLLYIQFSSTMGNIWIRNGQLSIIGAINVILYPFKEIKMWTYTQMWIINYWIWLLPLIILYIYKKKYINLNKGEN